VLTLAGLSLYGLNLLVGLTAQLRLLRFGKAHHVLYAVVLAAALAALLVDRHPALVLTVAALAVFPAARPRTIWHPALALLGLVGYLAAACC
jgi:hypothetical protein